MRLLTELEMETMNEFDLRRICDPESIRSLGSPWVVGGWKCATNGFVAMRVPTTEADSEGDYLPIAKLFAAHTFDDCTTPWPTLPCDAECSACYGTGKQPRECSRCLGMGCKSCSERGKRVYSKSPPCPVCLGAGRTPDQQCIGGELFVGNLLALISGVPGCRYSSDIVDNILTFVGDHGLQGLAKGKYRETQ